MSNHLSGPDFGPPAGDARLDITDLYLFTSPADPSRTAIVVGVNPMVPAMAPMEFHPDGLYQINVDTDGDAVTDIAFNVTFSPSDGGQRVTVRRADGADAQRLEDVGSVIVDAAPVSLGDDAQVVESGGYRVFVGLRSDPFFADTDGLFNNFAWTGVDGFAEANVLAIILEMPNSLLSSDSTIGVWARSAVRRDGTYAAIDRAGKPAMVNFFSPGEGKDAYCTCEPHLDQERHGALFVHILQEAGGYSETEATAMTGALLPDVLVLDRSKPSGEPNGRRLDDDSIDTRIAMMFNGKVPSHGLTPHTDMQPAFPYLGTPHPVPVHSAAS